MSNNSLSFITSYFIIIPAIAAILPPLATEALAFPITPPPLLSNHVEALIKEARDQAKIFIEGAEREAAARAMVAVRPLRDAVELLLVWWKKYNMKKPDQVLVRLKVEHSEFGTLDNQRSGSKFVEEAGPFRSRDQGDEQEGKIKPHIPRILRR